MDHSEAEHSTEAAPEFGGILEAVMLQALDEAREKMQDEKELVPFTALAVGDTLFIETHPADDVDECFKMAQHTVQNARGAQAYAFCYDGYVDTDEGELDAIIAEGGIPGEMSGHAVAYLYTVKENSGSEGGAEDADGVEVEGGATDAGKGEIEGAHEAESESEDAREGLEFDFEEQPIYLGTSPNFMEFTLVVEEDDLGEYEDEEDFAEDEDGAKDDIS